MKVKECQFYKIEYIHYSISSMRISIVTVILLSHLLLLRFNVFIISCKSWLCFYIVLHFSTRFSKLTKYYIGNEEEEELEQE